LDAVNNEEKIQDKVNAKSARKTSKTEKQTEVIKFI
jgi:hypothetical protein